MSERDEALTRMMRRADNFAWAGNDREATRLYIWAQTPQSVWDEYRENGYTIFEALRSEMSYA